MVVVVVVNKQSAWIRHQRGGTEAVFKSDEGSWRGYNPHKSPSRAAVDRG